MTRLARLLPALSIVTVGLAAFAIVPVVPVVAVRAAVKFTSVWAAPDAQTVSFKGQKVAALVMLDNWERRVPREEALARELTARGMTGVPAYLVIPKEELKSADRARDWFEKVSVAGVVVLRPVSTEKVKEHTAELWTSPSYSTLSGYYPYGWATVYQFGSREDTIIVVEAMIYKVSTGALVWGGVSEVTNPKNLQTAIGEIVKEAANKIQKQFR
jgi:hypothetical protein